MAKAKKNKVQHYRVGDGVVYADLAKLTKEETKIVSKFKELGYKVIHEDMSKKEVKRLNNAYIEDYLKKNADEKALKTYADIKEEQATDEYGNLKFREKKNGTKSEVKKGFNAARNWFSITYPINVQEAIRAIEAAKKGADLQEAFVKYEKNFDEREKETIAAGKPFNDHKKSQDEYTRDFYWKNVFVLPAEFSTDEE